MHEFYDSPDQPHDAYAAIRFINEIQPSPLPWLWPARIPLARLTLLIGDPGVGKSLLAADLAARVSAGLPWPDQLDPSAPARYPAGVLLASPEDDPQDTLLPRLTAAGANPDLVAIIDGVAATLNGQAAAPLKLPEHAAVLAQAVRAVTVPRLLILDHIHALAAPDRHEATLAALADIATSYGVAILAIAHLTKTTSQRILYRARGSLAFVAAARSVLLLTTDPADPELRILSSIKTIHAAPPPPLTFRITSDPPSQPRTQPHSPQSEHEAQASAPQSEREAQASAPADDTPSPDHNSLHDRSCENPFSHAPSIPESLDLSIPPFPPAPHLEWQPTDPAAPGSNYAIPPDLLDLAPTPSSALAEACAWLQHALAPNRPATSSATPATSASPPAPSTAPNESSKSAPKNQPNPPPGSGCCPKVSENSTNESGAAASLCHSTGFSKHAEHARMARAHARARNEQLILPRELYASTRAQTPDTLISG